MSKQKLIPYNTPQAAENRKKFFEDVRYTTICEKIWGCVPTDVVWAKSTILYKEAAKLEIS